MASARAWDKPCKKLTPGNVTKPHFNHETKLSREKNNNNNAGLPALLYRLIYVSDAVGAAGESVFVLADILGASDRNNRRDHLTGLLASHAGRFLQVLEGARADVDRLMRRLADDPRHQNLRVLSDSPISERALGWPMARSPLTAGLKAFLSQPVDAMVGDQAMLLLRDAARSLPDAA
jgi:hypothetical protein